MWNGKVTLWDVPPHNHSIPSAKTPQGHELHGEKGKSQKAEEESMNKSTEHLLLYGLKFIQ